MLCLVLFLGQADQIREEHTQSTHRAHTERTQSTHRNGSFSSYLLIDFLLILRLILLLGQADQIREEHTQSTHRAHTEHTQSPREATKPERAEVVV